MLNLGYNPNHKGEDGYWQCACGSRCLSPEEREIHKADCPQAGFTFVIGPQVMVRIKEHGARCGEDAVLDSARCPVSLKQAKERFSHLPGLKFD